MNLKERLINKDRPDKCAEVSINMDSLEDTTDLDKSTSDKGAYTDTRSSSELSNGEKYLGIDLCLTGKDKSVINIANTNLVCHIDDNNIEMSKQDFIKCFINAFGFVLDDSLDKAGYGRRFDRLSDEKKESFFRLAATMSPYGDILRVAKDIDKGLFPSYNKSRNFKLRTILNRAQVFASHYKYLFG